MNLKVRVLLTTSALVILAFGQSVHAGVILSFSPVSITLTLPSNGPQQFTIDVLLAADAGTQAVQAYNIPIDLFAPSGGGTPVGLTIVSVTPVINFSDPSEFNAGIPNMANVDLIGSDFNRNNPLIFGTTPTSLFQIRMQISDAAAPGDYTAAFIRNAVFSINQSNTIELSAAQIVATDTATINVQAVPEPGSIALLGVVLLSGVAISRRWRFGRLTSSKS